MVYIEYSCKEFTDALASGAPVPGGGGASALVGALGTALGSMVGNLTLGKKKYESVQDDIKAILEKAQLLKEQLLSLVDKDAEVFEPLSKAYGLPKNTEEEKRKRDEIMENALRMACSVPVEIMEKAMEAIALHEELATKGSRIAISDVGVGVLLCKSALMGASLNVFINTKLMKDRQYADEINSRVDEMLKSGIKRADAVYMEVESGLRK
ncbi:sugar ABC transporter substrate-binding protein [Clostridium thermosuccinogenes]|uniref:Sugar ABC transporter substrate-binding protein n=1 Tax=Clostridium thermosuccinogenes TaxID=84032 RepID=A0A2K2EWW4_9CLOT|nr:cyclodeaminase/cyclohydrolase family protein [Pseudoclostridium thermosuccinogenes]AUS98351.1 sugar ABC transporter substrate-binding protein [Pseudoclostridium thermosuccinogenes]PNT90999.1 sugar ABC transporter substrate-binding protein [Pseudoclostridium thermosuccinogenes]PNT98969.1 sugar ABC transporter substrate-binding protein [Pseudoclostridium thermosuccinogenes]PNU00884.1 sugar ABC transporter substrate-binding protein [Pseudoclostridium thermosuccinogenes]